MTKEIREIKAINETLRLVSDDLGRELLSHEDVMVRVAFYHGATHGTKECRIVAEGGE